MNQIRAIKALNDTELKNLTPPSASWHADHRHTAYVYFGSLPFELNEGDVCIIFSQYGEPVWVKLARDRDTGKSRGFGWLKYEDQRSTDLAVDNLNGADVLGRPLKVDHAEYKKKRRKEGGEENDDDEGAIDLTKEDVGVEGNGSGSEDDEKSGNETDVTEGREWPKKKKKRARENDDEKEEDERPALKEEKELARLLRDHDDEDPMKQELIREKRVEVDEAIRRWEKENRKAQRNENSRSHRHHHRDHSHRHRSAREDETGEKRRHVKGHGSSRQKGNRDYEKHITNDVD